MTSQFKPILLFAVGLLMAHAASAQSQSTATLRVKTDAADVEVWLDGESVGLTPLTQRNLTSGKHRIVLLKDGYEDHLQDVEVAPDKTTSIFVVMSPRKVKLPDLPLEFKVVHEHQLRSCRGTLTVSAEALDYKAENDADQFHIPISTIKSVVSTSGPVIANAPQFKSLNSKMAIVIETSGHTYVFWAFKETRKDSTEVANENTRELYSVVYKLWFATSPPRKSKS